MRNDPVRHGKALEYRELLGLLAPAISPGDCLLVHASFKSLGYVDGGPDTLIDVLLELVGADGTLVMPTATTSFARTGVFDVVHSPSETGLLSETFRRREGVMRSSSPMASFAAIGRHASRFVQAYHAYLDEASPFSALLDLEGKVLLYGVDYDKCTLFHLSEERRQSPYNAYRTFSGTIVDEVGRERPGSQTYFVRKSLDTVKDPRPACRAFDESGEVFIARVNHGAIRVFDARKFDSYCMNVLALDPDAFVVQPSRGADE